MSPTATPSSTPGTDRIHVDLPRVHPDDLVATQGVDTPPDPDEIFGANLEVRTRNGGW